MFSHADSAAGASHTTQNAEHTHTHIKNSGHPLISVAHCHGGAISHMLPANLPLHRPTSKTWLELWHEHLNGFTPEWRVEATCTVDIMCLAQMLVEINLSVFNKLLSP